MAIFGHTQSQRPQIGWTLVEHGWILYFTSGGRGGEFGPLLPQKMAFGGPRTPQKAQNMHLKRLKELQSGKYYDYFGPKKAVFGHCWGQKKTFSGVPNGHNWTHLGSLGLPMAQYGHIWPKKVIFGGSGGPQMPFFGGKKGPNSPPRCEVQCRTMFNQCSTHLGWLGLPKAKYGNFGPKRP